MDCQNKNDAAGINDVPAHVFSEECRAFTRRRSLSFSPSLSLSLSLARARARMFSLLFFTPPFFSSLFAFFYATPHSSIDSPRTSRDAPRGGGADGDDRSE